MNSPHSGHRERMRRKYLKFGPGVLSDTELAEIALYSLLPRRDTRPLAEELVLGHGGFPGVASLTRAELMNIRGVGEDAALFIEASRALAARAESQRHDGAVIRTLSSARRFLGSKFTGVDRELVLELCISGDGRAVACVPVHEGPFPPEKLDLTVFVSPAVRAGTRTVILAHNLVNFTGAPGSLEIDLIRELRLSLRALDIELIDYLIFFNNQCVSAVAAHILPAPSGLRDYTAIPGSLASKTDFTVRTLPEGS